MVETANFNKRVPQTRIKIQGGCNKVEQGIKILKQKKFRALQR